MAYIFVNVNRSVGTINPNIYGQFSEHLGRCIYQGIYVGQASDIPNTNGMRNDVVSALKALHVPVLRWPGGCFADTYHWRDGIGPKENRKTIVNTNWGGVTEDNSFGTHEFMELCRQIAKHISAAMWAAAPCRNFRTGWNTATWAAFPPWHQSAAPTGRTNRST